MKKIRFNEPYLTGNELKFIKDVFKQNHFYGVGKYTRKCEELISKNIGNNNVLLTDSCTSALEIAALIIKENVSDEVIMPSYTFTSTASAFVKAGFKVRFVDIDPYTAMLDPEKIESQINKNTRAIVVVHYAGNIAEIKKIKKLCEKHSLLLVEDAAQGYNSFLEGNAVGNLGDFGCYSFHETKNIHAGLSGALVVKRNKDYKRAMYIRERGTNRNDVIKGLSKKYSWVEVGGSFYPTELQSAFLFAQLKELKKNTNYRKKLFNYYTILLEELLSQNKIFYNKIKKNQISNYHAFFIITNTNKDNKELIKYLLNYKIYAYIGYVPLHSSLIGKKLGNKKSHLPNTVRISRQLLRLPLHNNMSLNDVKLVSEKIKNFYKEK